MKPWIGCNFPCGHRRLVIIGESHKIPNCSTLLNCDHGEAWYASCQDQALPNEEDRNWINTTKCVKDYLDPAKPKHTTYKKIDDALKKHRLCFDDIAFFNYVFRPVWECAGGYSNSCFNIGEKDRKVSAEIMHWFIREHDPTHVIVASSIIARWTCVEVALRDYRCIYRVVTYHPTARNGHFNKAVSRSLKGGHPSSEIVYLPDALKAGNRISQDCCKEIESFLIRKDD